MAELTRAAAGRGRETHGRRQSRRAQVRGGLRARSPCRWRRGTRARPGTERASPTQATASQLLPRGARCRPRCPVGPRRGAGAGLPPASSLARCWFTPSLGWDAAGGGAADAGCQGPGQVRAAASAAVRKSRYSPFTGLSASNCVWPSPCRRTGRRVRRHALPRPQVLQLLPGPEFAGRAQARAGGWHEWTPVVSAKGTRGWGALDPELRPPRRGAEPARGRGPDGDGGAASSGRSWARSAPATTPIPPGAKPAECNLVLKGNAPLHAC